METISRREQCWLVSRNGRGRPHPLTAADASSSQPAWSPDGTRIAFVRTHEDQGQLHVLPLEGGEPERVTDLPLGVIDPRWFPDGRRVAFLSPVYLDAPTPRAVAARIARAKEEGEPLDPEASQQSSAG